jgi:hypothetical protein
MRIRKLREPLMLAAICTWLVLVCLGGVLGLAAATVTNNVMGMREPRELFLFAIIGAWLVLICGAAVLGASVGMSIGVLRSSWWMTFSLGVLGFFLGIGGGSVCYWNQPRALMREASEYGLWMGLSGTVVFMVSVLIRVFVARRAPATPAPLGPLTQEQCYLCGTLLRTEEVQARVCVRCRE